MKQPPKPTILQFIKSCWLKRNEKCDQNKSNNESKHGKYIRLFECILSVLKIKGDNFPSNFQDRQKSGISSIFF